MWRGGPISLQIPPHRFQEYYCIFIQGLNITLDVDEKILWHLDASIFWDLNPNIFWDWDHMVHYPWREGRGKIVKEKLVAQTCVFSSHSL